MQSLNVSINALMNRPLVIGSFDFNTECIGKERYDARIKTKHPIRLNQQFSCSIHFHIQIQIGLSSLLLCVHTPPVQSIYLEA